MPEQTFTNEDKAFMDKAKAVLESLPPVKVKPLVVTGTTETCLCGKDVNILDLESINTSILSAVVSDVCKGCKQAHELDAKKSRLVCVKCKHVLPIRINPHTDTDGFVFLPGQTYHVDQCGLCTNNEKSGTVVRSIILEKRAWRRKNHLT